MKKRNYIPLIILITTSPLLLYGAMTSLFPAKYSGVDGELGLALGVWLGVPLIIIVGTITRILTRKSPDAKFLSVFAYAAPAIIVLMMQLFYLQ